MTPPVRPVRAAVVAPITIVIVLLCISAAPKKGEEEEVEKVAIKNLKYDPAKLKIKVGQTVQWTNKDDHDHTVIAAKDELFDSDNLSNGDTFKYTFTKAGTYEYYCKYHPRMKGSIVVEK